MQLNVPFEIIGDTLKYFEKNKNGDFFKYKIIGKKSLLIAVLADGISKPPCDWYVSQLVCNNFISIFLESETQDLELRIKEAVHATNDVVLNEVGICENLRSTMSLVVWDYATEKANIVSIGDSRIYHVSGNQVICTTVDDAIKRKQEVHSRSGTRTIEMSSLTNVIGIPDLKVFVRQIHFKASDMLVFASDGFYNAKIGDMFERDMIQLGSEPFLHHRFSELFDRYEQSTKDDMTALLIKNNKQQS